MTKKSWGMLCFSKAPKRRRGLAFLKRPSGGAVFAFLKRPSEGALCISKAPKWRRALHFLGAQAEGRALTKKWETKASNTNSQGNKRIPRSKGEHFRSRRRKVLRFVGLPQN